MFAFKTEHAF